MARNTRNMRYVMREGTARQRTRLARIEHALARLVHEVAYTRGHTDRYELMCDAPVKPRPPRPVIKRVPLSLHLVPPERV